MENTEPVTGPESSGVAGLSKTAWTKRKKLIAATLTSVVVVIAILGVSVAVSFAQRASDEVAANNASTVFGAALMKNVSAKTTLKSDLANASILLPALDSLVSEASGYLPDADLIAIHKARATLGAAVDQASVIKAEQVSAIASPQGATSDELRAVAKKRSDATKRLSANTKELTRAEAVILAGTKTTESTLAAASTHVSGPAQSIQSATQNADQASKDAFTASVVKVESPAGKSVKGLVEALNTYIANAKAIQTASAVQAAAAEAAAQKAAAQKAAAQPTCAEAKPIFGHFDAAVDAAWAAFAAKYFKGSQPNADSWAYNNCHLTYE